MGSFRKNGSGHLVHQMGPAFSHPTVAQRQKPGCASELFVVWDAMDRARIIATPTTAAIFVIARQVPLGQRAAVVRALPLLPTDDFPVAAQMIREAARRG